MKLGGLLKTKKKFVLFAIFLVSCKSNFVLKSLDETYFTDGQIFLSSSTLMTSYSYEFTNEKYLLKARSNFHPFKVEDVHLIESGKYIQKRNKIFLEPEQKICYTLGLSNSNEDQLIPYNSMGLIPDYFLVSKDTLSESQQLQLNFSEVILTLHSLPDKIVLTDNTNKKTYKLSSKEES